jgi:uncharacterized OB-fold protein
VKYVGEDSRGASLVIPDEAGNLALAASRCPTCSDVRVPARPLCPVDLTDCEYITLTGRGQIYETVQISMAPQGFEAPYWVGYVDLTEGARVFAQIDHQEGQPEPRRGDHVSVEIRQVNSGDEPVYGPVFRRVNDNASS